MILSTTRFPLAACAMAMALSGCVAAPLAQPLAQMALSSAPAKPPCPTGAECQTGTTAVSHPQIPASFSNSLHNLMDLASGGQKADAEPPAR